MTKHGLLVMTALTLAATLCGCAAEVVGEASYALETAPPGWPDRGTDPCESCFYLTSPQQLLVYINLHENAVPEDASIHPVLYSATSSMHEAGEWLPTQLTSPQVDSLHSGTYVEIDDDGLFDQADTLRTWIGWMSPNGWTKDDRARPVYVNAQ